MEAKQKLIGGRGVEFEHFGNRVIQGMLVGIPTNASTQAAGANGASDFNVNISAGMLACGNEIKEYVLQEDFAIENAATPSAIQVGEAKVYDIVAYKSRANGTVYLKVFAGAAALAASAVPPTDAEIEAAFASDTYWMRIGRTKVTRSADTTLAQTYDNTVRNTLVPGTVHYGTNPRA